MHEDILEEVPEGMAEIENEDECHMIFTLRQILSMSPGMMVGACFSAGSMFSVCCSEVTFSCELFKPAAYFMRACFALLLLRAGGDAGSMFSVCCSEVGLFCELFKPVAYFMRACFVLLLPRAMAMSITDAM